MLIIILSTVCGITGGLGVWAAINAQLDKIDREYLENR